MGHFEADLCFPKPEGTGVISLRLDSTLPPFGVCELSDTIDLPYHGRLLLAVEQLYIYDFFRLVRVRYRARKRATVEILPRDLTLETTLGVPNQDYSGLIEQPKRGFERNEQTDLRPYHAGDAVKDIHWKLSARSEEIIVKEFDRSSGQRFFVIADYSDRFVSPEDAEKPVFSKNSAIQMIKI